MFNICIIFLIIDVLIIKIISILIKTIVKIVTSLQYFLNIQSQLFKF